MIRFPINIHTSRRIWVLIAIICVLPAILLMASGVHAQETVVLPIAMVSGGEVVCDLNDFSIMYNVVSCFGNVIDAIAEFFIEGVVAQMGDIIAAIGTAVLILTMYLLVMGNMPVTPTLGMFTLKLLFVIYLGLNAELLIYYRNVALDGMGAIGNMFLRALVEDVDGDGDVVIDMAIGPDGLPVDPSAFCAINDGRYAIFETFDCVISKLIGLDTVKWAAGGSAIILVILVALVIWSGGTGITLLMFLISTIYAMVLAVVRAGLVYMFAFIALTFMFAIAPLMFPLLFFRTTSKIFANWVNHIIYYSLIPVVLIAFLSVFIYTMDSVTQILRGVYDEIEVMINDPNTLQSRPIIEPPEATLDFSHDTYTLDMKDAFPEGVRKIPLEATSIIHDFKCGLGDNNYDSNLPMFCEDSFGKGGSRGVNFSAPRGQPVFAAGDGTVHALGDGPLRGGYMEINHLNEAGEPSFRTIYHHLGEDPSISLGYSVGGFVSEGEVIGYASDNGSAVEEQVYYAIMLRPDSPLHPGGGDFYADPFASVPESYRPKNYINLVGENVAEVARYAVDSVKGAAIGVIAGKVNIPYIVIDQEVLLRLIFGLATACVLFLILVSFLEKLPEIVTSLVTKGSKFAAMSESATNIPRSVSNLGKKAGGAMTGKMDKVKASRAEKKQQRRQKSKQLG